MLTIVYSVRCEERRNDDGLCLVGIPQPDTLCTIGLRGFVDGHTIVTTPLRTGHHGVASRSTIIVKLLCLPGSVLQKITPDVTNITTSAL